MRKHRVTFLMPALLAVAALSIVLPVMAKESGTRHTADQGPRVIAVKFHADWCGYCKAMGNVFEEMQAKFDTLPVLYVTLDQTREFNRQQSRFLASALGLGDVWSEHGGQTGFILLIDGKTKSVISRLTHDQNLKTMGAALSDAVKRAPESKKGDDGPNRRESGC